jgi:hypothetical protein
VFQNYLSYSALARADDEAVAGGFNDRSRDDMKVIHADVGLHLYLGISSFDLIYCTYIPEFDPVYTLIPDERMGCGTASIVACHVRIG